MSTGNRGLIGALTLTVWCSVVLIAAGAPTAAQSEPTAGLTLIGQSMWLGPDDTVNLTVAVDAALPPEDLDLTVSMHPRLQSRSRFTRTLLGADLQTPLTTTTSSVADLEGRGDAVQVDLDPERLRLTREGVYPVSVSVRSDGAELAELVTHVVRLPDNDAPSLGVAWIQPAGAPPALQPDGSVELAERRDLRTVVTALARTDVPLSVLPTPETLDALRVAGDDLLTKLARSLRGRQVLSQTYVDLDPGVLGDAGATGELAAQRARAAGVVEALLDRRPDPRIWASDEQLTTDALGRLQESGVDRIVLPEDALEALNLDLGLTLTRPFALDDGRGGSLLAAAVEPGLAAHFTAGDDPVLAAHHLLADLAQLYFDAPGLRRRGVVVRPPESWRPEPAFLNTALSQLSASPVLRGLTLDRLFRRVELPFSSGEGPDEELSRQLDAGAAMGLDEEAVAGGVSGLRDGLTSLQGMIGPTEPVIDLVQRLALVAQADDLVEDERSSYLEGALVALGQASQTATVLDRGSYRLTSQEGTIPLTLRRTGTGRVRVRLELRSDELDFQDGNPDEPGRFEQLLTLDRDTTPIVVRVRTRTPGAIPLQVRITSPDGRMAVDQVRFTVRAIAPSGAGLVLSVGAGGFLLVWWGRHWRTVRRDRRLIEPTTAPA